MTEEGRKPLARIVLCHARLEGGQVVGLSPWHLERLAASFPQRLDGLRAEALARSTGA